MEKVEIFPIEKFSTLANLKKWESKKSGGKKLCVKKKWGKKKVGVKKSGVKKKWGKKNGDKKRGG